MAYQILSVHKRTEKRQHSCLPLMWKLMTEVVSKSLYEFREESRLLPGEQKRCRNGSRRTKYKLLTDKTILRDRKKTCKPCISWIDYTKTCDMVRHSWIKECLEIIKIKVADNGTKFPSWRRN